MDAIAWIAIARDSPALGGSTWHHGHCSARGLSIGAGAVAICAALRSHHATEAQPLWQHRYSDRQRVI